MAGKNRKRRYHGHRYRAAQALLFSGIVSVCNTAYCADETRTDIETFPAVPLTVAEDAVFLSAEEATQAIDGMGFEASGALLMRSGRWTANADRAVIDGDLRDPRQVRMHGTPARIVIERQDEERTTVEGHSEVLIFEPGREVLELSGRARVLDNGQSVSSESINYRLDSSTFSAGGSAGRVRVVSQPPASTSAQ